MSPLLFRKFWIYSVYLKICLKEISFQCCSNILPWVQMRLGWSSTGFNIVDVRLLDNFHSLCFISLLYCYSRFISNSSQKVAFCSNLFYFESSSWNFISQRAGQPQFKTYISGSQKLINWRCWLSWHASGYKWMQTLQGLLRTANLACKNTRNLASGFLLQYLVNYGSVHVQSTAVPSWVARIMFGSFIRIWIHPKCFE